MDLDFQGICTTWGLEVINTFRFFLKVLQTG